MALQSIEEAEESAYPEAGLSAQVLNENYNDYLALAGWEG